MKFIKGYEGLYQIDMQGNIYNFRTKRKLKNTVHKHNGYCYVSLCGKAYRVHRLVAESYISNPYDLPQVNHLNGIKTDNRVDNLEWCTNKQNCIHAIENSLNKSLKPVCQYDLDWNLIRTFKSTREASRETGIFQQNISYACNSAKNYACGYYWMFV